MLRDNYHVIWQKIQREVDYRWRLKGLSQLHHHLLLRLHPQPQSPTPASGLSYWLVSVKHESSPSRDVALFSYFRRKRHSCTLSSPW